MSKRKEGKIKLFNDKLLDKYAKRIEVSTEQKEALKIWVEKLERKELVDEKSNYPTFREYIIKRILGYSVEDFEFEKGNVEFTIKDQTGKPFLVLELKGQNNDLFARQGSHGKTPIEQSYSYSLERNTKYFAASNYKSIVFLLKETFYKRYEIFEFSKMLKDEMLFKKFLILFSKENLVIQDLPAEIKNKIIQEEKELTKEFYKLYHETRLMIIKELEELNQLPKNDAIHYSQILLNRIMFICFAQDSEKRLLEPLSLENHVLKPVENEMISEHSETIWQNLTNLFKSINLGDRVKRIPKYNGGLFLEDISQKIKIRDVPPKQDYFSDVKQGSKYTNKNINKTIRERLGEHIEHLSPIYINLLLISSFDFKSDINVNILGHIFEQSIGDIEDLRTEKKSQRKKFGIYYTPEYITDYICRNTIISYLSKNGNYKEIPDLIFEYSNSLGELENKLKKIKIVDPACGSGAFLNKAVDILLETHRALFEFKEFKGKYDTTIKEKFGRKKTEKTTITLNKYFDDIEQQREIILNNIYGVDLNDESVEITKLSLFLKIASKDIALPNLDENIKCGNSLIDDPDVADKRAFKWENEFEDIIKEGGFDIIVGNPPYVKPHNLNSKDKKFFWKSLRTFKAKSNLYNCFMEKGIMLLKEKGLFSFIVPHTWTSLESFFEIRKFILENCKIIKLVQLPKKVFQDATVETCVFVFSTEKDEKKRDKNKVIVERLNGNLEILFIKEFQQSDIKKNHLYNFGLYSDNSSGILKKIKDKGKRLGEYIKFVYGLKTGDDTKFIFDEPKNKECKKILRSKDIGRYSKSFKNKYVWYVPDLMKKHKKTARPGDKERFETEKIIVARMGKAIAVTYDNENYYVKDGMLLLKKNSKTDLRLLSGLLNSKLITYYYKNYFITVDVLKNALLELPIVIPDEKVIDKVAFLVNKLEKLGITVHEFGDKKTDERARIEEEIKHTDKEIDQLVYKLYGLTEKEIEIIEKETC